MSKNFIYVILITLFLGCKGKDGEIGPSGLNSLIKTSTELAGENCGYGGLKVETGLDSNGNSILDSDEVLKTEYICSLAGKNSLVNVENELAGATCSNGGIRIESGIDDNQNGTLDAEEIEITRYICNGVNGEIDEQTQIVLLNIGSPNVNVFSCSTNGELFGEVISFNKSYWIGADSIVFVPKLSTNNASSQAFAELYDATNETVINGSTVSTTNTERSSILSGNIYESLPNDEITLRILIRPEIEGECATLNEKSYLLIYRRL